MTQHSISFKHLIAFLILVCIPAQPVLCLYEKIELINIKSFDQKMQDSCPKEKNYFDKIIEKQRNASQVNIRSAVFGMLKEYEDNYPIKEHNVIGDSEWQALNLLMGTRSKPELLLGNRIDRAQLEVGKVELLSLISNPTLSVTDIRKRQHVIKELIENRSLFEKIQNCFNKLKNIEPLLYSFWNEDEFDGHVRSYVATSSILGLLSEHGGLRPFVETSSTAHQMSNALSHGGLVATSTRGLMWILFPVILAATYYKFPAKVQDLEGFGKKYCGLDFNPIDPDVLSLAGAFNHLQRWGFGDRFQNRYTRMMIGIGLFSMGAGTILTSMQSYKASLTLLRSIQYKLRVVAQFVAALQELEELIKNNDVLKESFSGIEDLNETLHAWPDMSTDFKSLIDNLNSGTFKSDFSIFSYAGRIFSTYFLMEHEKSKLVPGLRALGQMDAYMSCARLYNEGQGRENSWSFAEFIEHPTPYMEVRNYWNPFYEPEKAVPNSLSVGCNGIPKSAIITGPNAGGKSSNIKNIGLVLILAQSIGMVPGHLTCTPFSKIVTHMNIVDDMAEGKSHFVASVVDARRPMNIVKSALPGEFIVIITDEMLNDTRYQEGQAAAFSIVEDLGKNAQTICLSATHFPLLTELEKMYPQLFKNYKVSVNYDAQGKIVYPFKLEAGISHQNVAFDILRQEGFDDAFLARAQEIIALENNNIKGC